MKKWWAISLIFVVLLTGGYFLFEEQNQNQKLTTPFLKTSQIQKETVPTPTPTPVVIDEQSDLYKETEMLKIDDFSDDLQSLKEEASKF